MELDVLQRFEAFKSQLNCDDQTAALLVLADSIEKSAYISGAQLQSILEVTPVKVEGDIQIDK